MNWHYCVDLHAFITGLQEYYTDAFLFEDAEESVPDSPTIDHLDVENASSTDLLAPLSPADVIIHNEKREDDGEGLIQGGDSALTVFSLERSPNITLDQGAPGPKRILPLLEGPGDYHSIPPKYIAPSSIAATVSGSFKSRIDPKDAWTVTYINSQYTHEIIDAVDKDNSGFITQREANLFVSMKPDGFSLPEWIAYWAAGWPVETNIYRDKIMALYAKMLSIELQSKLILENRPYATFFLQSYSLGLVSGICESLNVRTTDDVKLKTLLNELMRRREHALEKRLKAIKFHIGDQGTLDLVCGKHRFETCLLPLLYLLLKHQYNTMLLCTEKVVDVCDLWEIGESYRIISDHIYSKTSDLYARTFGKERRNTLDFFDYYGNGIYKEYYMMAYNVHDSALSLEDIRRQERDKEMGKDLPQGDSQHLGSDAESFLRRKCFDLDQYKAHVHDDMVDNFIKEFSSNETSPLDTFYDYINICYAEAPESISTVIENAEEQELQQTDHNNQTMSHDDWLATQRTARAAIYPYPHHSNINCDGCATSGLRTVRFKCLDCPDYDLCTDCISKELATLEKQSPDHTRTHNMIRLITPLPTWHTMIEMPKWRNIIGEFMLTNSGQADLKCSGICDTADFEGDIYKCIDCGSVTCAACDLPYDPNVPYVSPLQDSDVALPHMPAHKVIVIKDRDVDRYKREKSLGQETSKDMQDMVFDIKKRLTKMEANDGSISELKAELQRIGDENAALKRDFAELKNSMAIILQHIMKGDAQLPEIEDNSDEIIDIDVLEASKENIQPLKSGRRVTALSAVFSTPYHQRDAQLSSVRAQLRAEVEEALKTNEDPLSAYATLVYWTIEQYPQGHSAESGILELLEEATRTLKDDQRYKEDLRYLKLWVLYANYIERPTIIYAFLLANNIGTSHAILYEEYAIVLERDGRRTKADEIYLLGIARKAEPLEHLQNKHREFQKRMMISTLNPESAESSPPSSSTPATAAAPRRKVLGERAVPVPALSSSGSTSTPSASSRMQIFADPAPSASSSASQSAKSKSNARMAVFVDGVDGGEDTADTGNAWPEIGTRKTRIKENVKEATKMAETTYKQRPIKTNSRIERIVPYVDPEPEADDAEAPVSLSASTGLGSAAENVMKQKLTKNASEAEALRKDPFKNYSEKVDIEDI